MSDSYITIVPINVTRDEAAQLSQRTFDWLTEKEIISGIPSDCVLGPNPGYRPGPRYKDIIDSADDYELLELGTNGLQIIAGERHVFDNGGNGLEKMNCPECGANNIEADWGEIVGAWYSGQNDKLKCDQCGKESSITDFEFKPTWGFGEFGITFWNWPPLKEGFLKDLKNMIGKDIRLVYGRV